MSESRLKSFLFAVFYRDGTSGDVVFYGITVAEATKHARAWAQRLGHRRVELVDDEVSA